VYLLIGFTLPLAATPATVLSVTCIRSYLCSWSYHLPVSSCHIVAHLLQHGWDWSCGECCTDRLLCSGSRAAVHVGTVLHRVISGPQPLHWHAVIFIIPLILQQPVYKISDRSAFRDYSRRSSLYPTYFRANTYTWWAKKPTIFKSA